MCDSERGEGSYPCYPVSRPQDRRARAFYHTQQPKGTAMFGTSAKTAAFAVIFAVCFGSPAFAQMQCGGYADAVAFLSERYGEALTVQGIDGAGNVIAMFANPDTGTWTALIVYPDGNACMASSGQAFEYHKPKPNA